MTWSVPESDLHTTAARVAASLGTFDGARILVTGATGFVGTWLVELLAYARAHHGAALQLVLPVRDRTRLRARLPQLADAPWIHVTEGDIRALSLPVSVDLVVHAASTVAPRVLRADPLAAQRLVIDGTAHVMTEAAARGARRLLLVSSGSVYGSRRGDALPIGEQGAGWVDPFAPGRLLAEAKRAAEAGAATLGARLGVDVVVARGFAMSGPWLPLDADFALGNFVGDVLAGRPIRLSGDGRPVRSYLYGGDVAGWLCTLLARGTAGVAYNVGGTTPYSIAQVAALVAACGDVAAPVVPSAADGSAPADYFVPDVGRAASLGLDEWTSLETAVQRMLAWHRGRTQ